MTHRFVCWSAGLALLSFSIDTHAADVPSSSCSLGKTQQAWLERVNRVRGESRQCGDSRLDAVEPLDWSCTLEAAARAYSQDMAKNDFFSHTNPAGEGVGERVNAQGYDWWTVGENIAAGQDSIDAVIEGWLSSPGHCANLMSEEFTELGMARAEAPGSKYSPYWTQIFGRPR